MRISDWSSYVCSSDLHHAIFVHHILIEHNPSGPVGLALLLSIESRDLGCDIRVKAVIGEPFAIAVDGNAMRRSGQPHAVGCLSVNRSEEHTSELQSLMRISYAVFCLKKKTTKQK